MVSSMEDVLSEDGVSVAKVDSFFFAVTRLRKRHAKNDKPMFQNKECDASIGKVASTFILSGVLNSDVADVFLYSLREKYQDTDKLIVHRWVTTKILNGDIDGNVRQWFTNSGVDGHNFVLFRTFDPSELVAGMKPSEDVDHSCLVLLNLKFHHFELQDSLRDETWSGAINTGMIVDFLCYKTTIVIIVGRMVWLNCWITHWMTFLTLGTHFCILVRLVICLRSTSVVCSTLNLVSGWILGSMIRGSLAASSWRCNMLLLVDVLMV